MAEILKPLLLSFLVVLVCLSMFPPAFASPVRVARTRQSHDEYLRQRQLSDRERKLTDIVDRGSRPPLHLVETKASFDKEHRDEELREQGGAASDGSSATPIQYWGGPVLSDNTLNVYLIYYGFWPKQSAQTVIENFIRSLSLGGADAQGEVADPKVSSWWATSSKYYSQASDGSAPTVSTETSPNGKPWLDAMVSTIAHEIAEAATDPNASSGWFDANGEENADKCSYEYGETQTAQNVYGDDAEYNLVGLNGMKFMVQQNWDVATDSPSHHLCSASHPTISAHHPIPPSLLLIPSHHLCSSSHPTISAPQPIPPSLLIIPSHHLCSSSHPTISGPHPIPPSLLIIPSHHLSSSSHPTISAPHPIPPSLLIIPSHHLSLSSQPAISTPHPIPPSLLLITSHHPCSSSHLTISALHPIPPPLLINQSQHLCSPSHPAISAPQPIPPSLLIIPSRHLCSSTHHILPSLLLIPSHHLCSSTQPTTSAPHPIPPSLVQQNWDMATDSCVSQTTE
ncbi:unnamed protein product [Closterium sp. Naga37s-1]|nr:unnamed protein product [Closterium sp. Naga37s-1]